MLPRQSLNAALPLAEQLDARKLFLTPITGTPLEALVRTTRSDSNFNQVDITTMQFTPDLDNIEFICNVQPTDGTVNAHDATMDQVTLLAAEAVQNHLAFAKTVVAPAVQELVEKVTVAQAGITTSSLLGMEVQVFEFPAPLSNSALEAAVRKYAHTPMDTPAMNVRMPDFSAAQIIETMASGSGGLDRDVKDWLATMGEDFLLSVWSGMFQVKPVDVGASAKNFTQWIEDKMYGPAVALVVFLLARRLVDEVPEGVEMNLPALQTALADYRNQAAARLCRAYDELATMERAGTLVRAIYDRCTVVNGPVYKRWIDEGGQNEVLFGNMLSAQKAYTVEAINAAGADLLANWHRHSALTATVEANRAYNRTKELLLNYFIEQISAVAEGDESLAGNRAQVIQAFRDELELVSEEDLRDLYGCTLKLVCRSRFCHTQAERILFGIERVKRDNPQIDVREAAAISVIEYVAWWVATQFKVEAL